MLQRALPPRPRRWARSRRISSQGLTPGDTFMFAGQILRFEGMREHGRAEVTPRQRRRDAEGAGL